MHASPLAATPCQLAVQVRNRCKRFPTGILPLPIGWSHSIIPSTMNYLALSRCPSFSYILQIGSIAAVLVVLTEPALGESGSRKTSVGDLERTARKACSTGNFEKGIDLLADLFVETRNPTYIHNQARCYQENDRPALALPRFREYLRKVPNLAPEERARVDKYMAECAAMLGKKEDSRPEPTSAQPVANTDVSVRSPLLPQPLPSLPPPPPSDPNTGRGLRVGGVVSMAVGVAALGLGLAFNLASNGLDRELAAGNYTRDKSSRRDSYRTWGWVSYGVGAAAMATGLTAYLLGLRANRTAESGLALVPDLCPGQATLSLKGAF